MKNIKLWAWILCFVLLFSCRDEAGAAESADAPPNQNTILQGTLSDAQRWLQLVDKQAYPQSWDQASLTLKLTVPKNHWINLMESLRKPYGSLTSRNLLDQRLAKDPAGLPRGDYAVLIFQSAFSKKDSVKELVTLVQERDGTWRVLTYQTQ